jgi:PAS domain S-box-containing protein
MILLTGVGDVLVEGLLEDGAADYIDKNRLDPASVALAIRYAIARWRLKSEAAMADRRFRDAFESAAVGMVLVEGSGLVVAANPSFEQLAGHRGGELAGRPLSGMLLSENGAFDVSVSGGHDAGRGWDEGKLEASDGSVRDVQVVVSGLRAPWQGASHIVQVVDVTPIRRAQRDLEAALRSKDEFLATVSHELRTPLTAVIGYAVMLVEHVESMSESDRAEMLRILLHESRELSYIIEDLLVAARGDVDQITVVPECVDIRAQIQEVLAPFEASGTGVPAVVGDSPKVNADPLRLRQIVRNLVTNAIRYGGANLELRIAERDDRVSLEMVDDGPGVAPEVEGELFAPYARARGAGRQPASLGLGLSVCRQLARLMDGDLRYHRVGGETVFELELPSGRE